MGFTLEPSKQPIIILCFSEDGRKMACVIISNLRFSSRIKVKNSSVLSLLVEYLLEFIKHLAEVGLKQLLPCYSTMSCLKSVPLPY